FVSIRMAPPLNDTSIVPEVPGVLYALFDYGLTFSSIRKKDLHMQLNDLQVKPPLVEEEK
ncbi:hypothetical protein, partial [Solibacillus cecembensis]|uniref:hypothetical protein n=1 Tax=Solibacillus cecembensis TaxID=459347 RepID=UPI003CFD51C4